MPGWANSDRRDRLPRDWHRRRAIARRNAGGQCQWHDDGARCPAPGTDCDHIVPGDNHDPANLQWLCKAHHQAKTIAERPPPGPSRRVRPVPQHPGAIA